MDLNNIILFVVIAFIFIVIQWFNAKIKGKSFQLTPESILVVLNNTIKITTSALNVTKQLHKEKGTWDDDAKLSLKVKAIQQVLGAIGPVFVQCAKLIYPNIEVEVGKMIDKYIADEKKA